MTWLQRELANFSLISLRDGSAGVASTNGGTFYAQNVSRAGPVVGLFAEFERRVRKILRQAGETPPKFIR